MSTLQVIVHKFDLSKTFRSFTVKLQITILFFCAETPEYTADRLWSSYGLLSRAVQDISSVLSWVSMGALPVLPDALSVQPLVISSEPLSDGCSATQMA